MYGLPRDEAACPELQPLFLGQLGCLTPQLTFGPFWGKIAVVHAGSHC